MKNNLKFLVLITAILTLSSCVKDDPLPINPPIESIAPYATQYPIDIQKIETYLDEYTIENVNTDLSISFKKIPNPNVNNLVSIRNQTLYPLQFKNVTIDNVVHKVYYLSLRTGTQITPTLQNDIICSYKGLNLDNMIFDYSELAKFNLGFVIQGWKEIIPLFKSGVYTKNADGSMNTSTDFGAGVMFLPSALGYYNRNVTSLLPSYSPLIFTFKLRHVE